MKRFLIMMSLIAVTGVTTNVYSQWLRGLGYAAERAAQRAVERSVERQVDKAIDRSLQRAEDETEKAINRAEEKNRNKNKKNQQSASKGENVPLENVSTDNPEQPSMPPPTENTLVEAQKNVEIAYAKSDFVRGDEIIFEDDLTREQIGECPSQWDLIDGSIEVASLNGEKVIYMVTPKENAIIAPLFENMKNYLPEMFTIEFDFWVAPFEQRQHGNNLDNSQNRYCIDFLKKDSNQRMQQIHIDTWYYNEKDFRKTLNWGFNSLSEEWRTGEDENTTIIPNAWNHIAISFNRRAMKIYLNGTRYTNIPNTIAPGHFVIHFDWSGGYFQNNSSIKNIRIAKGAVPLYDRMMNDGKFITYGITFDVGKATIKTESMGEINRIVKLMTENPDLKFSVEGHTDSTGNASANQVLSEERSQAIVAKLIEAGIAKDRLTAVGKGQNAPIADNSTDKGRAKNRRVEFVKM